jgi:Zn-dependent protease/CBS domain-containing protein
MNASVSLGRVWGIPIGLHWSLFIVFMLLTTSLGGNYFPNQYPTLSSGAAWLLGVVTSVLFFASVLLHELGHAWVALRNNIPVNGITLFIFGGVAQIGAQAKTPGAEFRIAAGGPVVSFLLALGFGLLWLVDRNISYLGAPSGWLAFINLMLLLFNLLPGYPLDGGRMLRAAVWHFTGDEKKGLRVAAISGQVVAFGLMALGAFTILGGDFWSGLWYILIGFFLQNATIAEQAASTLQGQLGNVRVGQAMSLVEEPQVPSRLKLRQLVDDHVLTSGNGYFLVVDGDQPRGVVTLRDVTQVPRNRWEWASVGEIMTPWNQLERVSPTTELLSALRTMEESRSAQVPVVDGDRLVGLLTRDEILRYLRLRAELGM